jgi:hypothetical protein
MINLYDFNLGKDEIYMKTNVSTIHIWAVN